MSTTMEIYDRLQGDLRRDILLLSRGLDLLRGSVEAVDVRLVVILVVEFHDLTGDGWLERAVIICNRAMYQFAICCSLNRSFLTWKIWKCGFASNEAHACHAGSSGSSKCRASDIATSAEQCSRHDEKRFSQYLKRID